MSEDTTPRSPEARPTLKRGVSRSGFFAMAFGSMIGVGWVTAMGGWMADAGPLGAVLGFVAGGTLMVCIGLCYAELCAMLPVAGGEVAYSYKAFGATKAFLIGWPLAFGYLAVSVFEAISVGWVFNELVPGTEFGVLYETGETGEERPVFASELIFALLATVGITWVNFRGGKGAAALQIVLVSLFGAATLVFVAAGLINGSQDNVTPLFQGEGLAFSGILSGIGVVFVTAPFWFVGFDTIPQAAEEASESVRPRTLATLILVSIVGATLFYVAVIWSVASTAPWQDVAAEVDKNKSLFSVEAFELAFGSKVMAKIVLFAAFLGLFTSWNGFFLAGSRVLFALGRGRIAAPALGEVHAKNGSPKNAILVAGAVTFAGAFLGRGRVGSVFDAGSFCIALAFFGVTMSLIKLRYSDTTIQRPYRLPGGLLFPIIAGLGGLLILGLLLVRVEGNDSALSNLELGILAIVFVSGAVAWVLGKDARTGTPETERAQLILGEYAEPERAGD